MSGGAAPGGPTGLDKAGAFPDTTRQDGIPDPRQIPREEEPFQARVRDWLLACFGEQIASDRQERSHRFLEEALELAQACGCTRSEALQLVDYVYNRQTGEPAQEVGGVMTTLAALCSARGLDMMACAEVELRRVWTKIEAIRAKQAAKPKHSPLPEPGAERAAPRHANVPLAAPDILTNDFDDELFGLCRSDDYRGLYEALVRRVVLATPPPAAPAPAPAPWANKPMTLGEALQPQEPPADIEAQVDAVLDHIQRIEILTRKKYQQGSWLWQGTDAQLREARNAVVSAIRRMVGQ